MKAFIKMMMMIMMMVMMITIGSCSMIWTVKFPQVATKPPLNDTSALISLPWACWSRSRSFITGSRWKWKWISFVLHFLSPLSPPHHPHLLAWVKNYYKILHFIVICVKLQNFDYVRGQDRLPSLLFRLLWHIRHGISEEVLKIGRLESQETKMYLRPQMIQFSDSDGNGDDVVSFSCLVRSSIL